MSFFFHSPLLLHAWEVKSHYKPLYSDQTIYLTLIAAAKQLNLLRGTGTRQVDAIPCKAVSKMWRPGAKYNHRQRVDADMLA